MKRHSIFLASAALVAVLAVSGSAWAQLSGPSARWGYQNYPYDTAYNQGSYDYYGSPNYNYSYNYGYPNGYTGYSSNYSGATAPMVTGRSVATSQPGNYCSTPAKTCELYHTSFVGNGCSCRVPGGRARGTVASSYGYSPAAYNNPLGGYSGR